MLKFLKISVFLLLILLCKKSEAYNNTIDSLLTTLKICNDSSRSGIYNKLSHLYKDSAGNNTIDFANKAIEHALKYDQKEELIHGFNNLGFGYLRNGNYTKALEVFLKSEDINKKINKKDQLHSTYTNLGIIYKNLEELDLALEYSYKALNISRQLDEPAFIVQSLINIGNILVSDGDTKNGTKYYKNALDESHKIENYFDELPILYNNLGYVHHITENYAEALIFYEKAYNLFDSLNNTYGMSILLNNIAEIKIVTNDFSSAEEYIYKADSLHNLNHYDDARKNLYYTSFQLYYESGDYKRAIKYLNKYYELKDSIYSKELDITVNELKTKYEVDKLKLETETKDLIIKQKEKINLLLIIILVVISILSILLIKAIKEKSGLNKLLISANDKLTMINKETTDNLNYARKIQLSCMNPGILNIHYKHFVIDLPKSIVGGDFYLFREKINRTYIALADSTGHGISAGFLSVLGIQYLNIAINQFDDISDILNHLNINFYNNITKSNNLSGESLCISIICIENDSVKYAGSKHKIWKYISSNNSIIEYKTDTHAIGTSETSQYITRSFSLEENDCIFLSSDGFPDQFGSHRKEKLKYHRFRELLLKSGPMNEDEGRSLIS